MENKQYGSSNNNLGETTQPDNSMETEVSENHQLPNETREEMVGRILEHVEHMSRDLDGIRDEVQQWYAEFEAEIESLSSLFQGLGDGIVQFEIHIGDDDEAIQEVYIVEEDAEEEEPMEEEVTSGLTEEAIQEYLNRAYFQVQDRDMCCCICLDTYEGGAEKRELECGHIFHYECIRRWLLRKNSCPLCNRAVFNLH